MSEDDKNSGILTRVQRAVRSTGQRAGEARSGLTERVRSTFEQTLAPAIEEAAEKMLLRLAEPENAEKLQETLAGFAQFAMKSGFRSDPNAALLFEFVDQLEKRHSREQVLEIVVQHAMVYERDLLAMVAEAVQSGRDARSMGAENFDGFRERASTRLLTLLCSLAAIERDGPVPDAERDKVAYFEEAPIEERFKPLARMAAGDRDAFDRPEDESERAGKDSPGLLRRAVKRLSGQRTTALAKFVPSLSDPATRFLTTSYLFFMQSYLVRAMIEELPAMLAMVRDLDRETRADADSADVIEVND